MTTVFNIKCALIYLFTADTMHTEELMLTPLWNLTLLIYLITLAQQFQQQSFLRLIMLVASINKHFINN